MGYWSETSVEFCNDKRDKYGRSNKTDTSQNEPPPARSHVPDMDCHFRRIGSGDEVRCAEHVEKILVSNPSSALDDLILHHGNMRGRSTKSRETETEKKQGEFFQLFSLPDGIEPTRLLLIASSDHSPPPISRITIRPTTIEKSVRAS